MFAVQVESRHPVAHCLCGFRCRFMYCLPHFFKDGLDIRREGTDVFVNGCEELFVCHIFVCFLASASSTYLLGKGGKPGGTPGTPAGGFPCTPFPNSSGDFALGYWRSSD